MSFLNFLPEVKKPVEKKLSLKKRLIWTGIVLVAFFFLSQIPLYGLEENLLAQFEMLSMLFGASFGSLLTLGIGPIVTASIVLQLLMGAGVIKLDTGTQEGRAKYQSWQKVAAILFMVFEAAVFVFFGALSPSSALPKSQFVLLQWGLLIQLVVGAFLVLLMDEICSKWGIGSGISLFIAAGVSKQLFISLLSPFASPTNPDGGPIGILPALIYSLSTGFSQEVIINILALVSTVVIFLVIVYVQSMNVNIPLSMGNVRGYIFHWPLNFLYTSNMPVILAAALLQNLQLFAGLLNFPGEVVLAGTGFFNYVWYYLSSAVTFIFSSIVSPERNILKLLFFGGLNFRILLGSLIYIITISLLALLFGILWVKISKMDSENVAEQMVKNNFSRPGFRSNKKVLERLLDRYIPYITVFGALTVGLLAAGSDVLGALVSGTGLLLTVMIIYKFYEDLSRQYAEEMPNFRKAFKR
jgi:preprotein translocase subunit SecY